MFYNKTFNQEMIKLLIKHVEMSKATWVFLPLSVGHGLHEMWVKLVAVA